MIKNYAPAIIPREEPQKKAGINNFIPALTNVKSKNQLLATNHAYGRDHDRDHDRGHDREPSPS